jgi:hypothetical protein
MLPQRIIPIRVTSHRLSTPDPATAAITASLKCSMRGVTLEAARCLGRSIFSPDVSPDWTPRGVASYGPYWHAWPQDYSDVRLSPLATHDLNESAGGA